MEQLSVDEVIDRLGLEPHPEGGYYQETWRSDYVIDSDALPGHPGPRSAGTSILYLLPAGSTSDWHRIRSEEIWMFHAGNPIELSVRPEADAAAERRRLGRGEGEQLHSVVPRGWWQRAESEEGPGDWSLAACVVVPGFEFEDFELADS